MNREIELKYSLIKPTGAHEFFNIPLILKHLKERPRLIKMLSSYYDTPCRALAEYGGSLRKRRENSSSVVTFKSGRKSAGALSEKNEWQVHAESLTVAIPLLIDAGAPESVLTSVLEAGYNEIARVSFTRCVARVAVIPDLVIEAAHDTGFFIKGDKKQEFSEIELELINGDVSELQSFGALLEKKIHIKPEKKSKLARALAL